MRSNSFVSDCSEMLELRLLLSSLSDWVSVEFRPLMLDVGVTVLHGRDRRRSRSISERSGRFGVS